MLKLKYFLVPLLLAVLLVSSLVPANAETIEGLCPETPEEASIAFNVPIERLSRLDGGCGWYTSNGEPLNGVIVPRYFRLDTAGEPEEGSTVVDGVVESTHWLVGAPYTEPQLEIVYSPIDPTIDEEIVFSLVGDSLPPIAKYIKWYLDNETVTLSIPAGTTIPNYYNQVGTYSVSVEVLNEYNEVLYVVSAVEVVVVEKQKMYQVFLPLVAKPTNWIPFTEPVVGYCPIDLTKLVGVAEWEHLDPCSYRLVNWEEDIPLTIQKGMRADVWNFETEEVDQYVGPTQLMSEKRPLSVHVLVWWP